VEWPLFFSIPEANQPPNQPENGHHSFFFRPQKALFEPVLFPSFRSIIRIKINCHQPSTPSFKPSTPANVTMAKLTLVQKKDLRAWHKKQLTKPSLKQTAAYALRELNVKVHDSQISRLLSNKFEALDTLEAAYLSGKGCKLRVGQYSTLEEILYRWQVEMESRGVPIIGEVLQAHAVKIWNMVEAAREGASVNPPPTFGPKWLALFKERHNIKRRIFHGEAGSV